MESGCRHPVSSRRRAILRAAASLPLVGLGGRAASAEVVRIGLTPVFLDDQISFLEHWRKYLENRLSRPIRFIQRGSYSEVLRLLLEGQAEFAWLCGFPYWQHRHRLKLVAAPVYRGEPLYQSYLIRSANRRGINRLEDLRGAPFAYSDPDSNSGFLYVQHRLRETGVSHSQFFGRSFFTWAHRRVVEAVSLQLAHAGAVDGYVWDVLSLQHPELTDATTVFEKSRHFGFPPIVTSDATRAETVTSMRAALLGMKDDAAGTALLATLVLDGFETVEPSLYESIGRMAEAQ